ncbi:MAG: hypothetical protein R3B49_02040 [Phycisphaerales bacterium]
MHAVRAGEAGADEQVVDAVGVDVAGARDGVPALARQRAAEDDEPA